MKRTWLPLCLILLCFALAVCNKQPTAPEPLEPGSRNYTWKLDTLNMPMNYIESVWGAAPNDVWTTGRGGTEYDRLLHYDGVKWSTYTKETIWCSASTLFGFSADNVWMGGGAGWLAHGAGIWHYNGAQWSQNYVYDIEGSYSISVEDIWGTTPNDVYACGAIGFHEEGKTDFCLGFVLHFDGKNWKEVVRAQPNSQFLRIKKEQNRVYVQSYEIDHESSAKEAITFYEVKGSKLKKIYSGKLINISWASHNVINGKVYFVIGQNVYRYLNGKMVEQLSIPYSNLVQQIWGRNELDLFFPMKDGLVHYNGTDMEYIYKFHSGYMSFMGIPIIFEKDIFICTRYKGGPWYNMVLHGRLP